MSHLHEHTRMLHRLNDSGVRAAILAALAERREQPPAAELLWSGPEPSADSAEALRDPALVVADMLNVVERDVLIVGYDFSWGRRMFEPAIRRLLQQGAEVRVVVDVERNLPDPRPEDRSEWPGLACRRYLERNWPTLGERRPRMFCLNEGLEHDAKCLVLDGREAIVTSADLSDIGETTEVEVGVLLRDPGFASRLVDQWDALIESGSVQEVKL
jgi:phosphatidylserine/phosphatidylglycerophosphate/cardiolipin synthase-like enzyme